MKLFEVVTGLAGESYWRAYVWATDEAEARELFRQRHGELGYRPAVRELLDGDNKTAFCTEITDDGWPD